VQQLLKTWRRGVVEEIVLVHFVALLLFFDYVIHGYQSLTNSEWTAVTTKAAPISELVTRK